MRTIIIACALMLQDQFNRDGQVLAIQLQVTGAMKSQVIAKEDDGAAIYLEKAKKEKDDDSKKSEKKKDGKKSKSLKDKLKDKLPGCCKSKKAHD